MQPELLIAAFLMDLWLGDPRSVPHPVQGMGYMVSRAEELLLKACKTPASERIAGAFMAVLVVLAVYLVAFVFLAAVRRYLGWWVWAGASVYLAYTTISVKSLADAAMAVLAPLRDEDNIDAARRALSMIVGRDTETLGQSDIVRATVETVAENASDGVTAPLFYLAIGGAPLALAYKAVNTMDSMVGYRSEKYVNFGMAAARLDDAANFLPARLTGLFMVAASFVLSVLRPGRFSEAGAWRIFLRDRREHSSPNSGHPEAAMAGALGVRLGGESSYFGVGSVKPYIGDPDHSLGPEKIEDAVLLMKGASVAAAVFSAWLAALVGILSI